MFIGHLGVGLALKSAEPRVNVGIYIFASLLLDILLGIFVLSGIERISVPPHYSQMHYLEFYFPYSHSLAAAIVWSLMLGGGAYGALKANAQRGHKVAVLLGLAVLLHWVCDWLEHPLLPLWIGDSGLPGPGLWNHLAVALALEVLLVTAGIVLYLRAARHIGTKARAGMVLLMALLSALAVVGQLMVTQAPAQSTVAASLLVQALVVCALVAWIDHAGTQAH